MVMPTRVLIIEMQSAPADSTARAISAMSVTFGESFTSSGRSVRARAAAVAALFTTLLFELARHLFSRYLGSFHPGSLYTGTIAALVIVVVWVYYAALIFILGGEVGQVHELRRTRRLQRAVLYE